MNSELLSRAKYNNTVSCFKQNELSPVGVFLCFSVISPARIWLLWLSALLWSRLSVTWWPLSWPHSTHHSCLRYTSHSQTPCSWPRQATKRQSVTTTPRQKGGFIWGWENILFQQSKYVLNVSCFKGYHGVLHADCWTPDWQQFCPSWLSERAKVNWICVCGLSVNSIHFKTVYKIGNVTFIGFCFN